MAVRGMEERNAPFPSQISPISVLQEGVVLRGRQSLFLGTRVEPLDVAAADSTWGTQ